MIFSLIVDEKTLPIGADTLERAAQEGRLLVHIDEKAFCDIVVCGANWIAWSAILVKVLSWIRSGEFHWRDIAVAVIPEKLLPRRDPQISDPENPVSQEVKSLAEISTDAIFCISIHTHAGADTDVLSIRILSSALIPQNTIAGIFVGESTCSPSRVI